MGIKSIRHILRYFLSRRKSPVERHQAEIDAAIERLLYEINPRLAFLPGYGEKLGAPVWHALQHIEDVIDRIAGPLDASTRQWISTPELRAMFGSGDEMGRIFNRGNVLQVCAKMPDPDDSCYAMLASTLQVRKVLGMELRGETMLRDVPQTQISFTDHRVIAASASETALREKTKGFALEFMAQRILANIEQARSQHNGLEQELAMLRARLRMKRRQDQGKACLCERIEITSEEVAALYDQIKEKEAELAQTAVHTPTLDFFLHEMLKVLTASDSLLSLQTASWHLDDMNIVRNPSDQNSGKPIELTEVMRAGHPARSLLIVRIPHDEIHEEQDNLSRIDDALKLL
ncbi:MAG: hypothetical protein Q8O37_06820 [Sulfuricellaceae bacterium]|nr:hypothetical protein [Sulfuricellaceae bacterium]